MKYTDLEAEIFNSNKSDWKYNDDRGCYTYLNDVNLRIQKKDINLDFDKFSGEDWAVNHPDKSAYRVVFEVYYSASFLFDFNLVAVDGFRAYLPLPNAGTIQVLSRNYHLAEIIDFPGTLVEYMKRARLVVVD